ncbi:iron ABC transporter permease [Phocaeicola vulgatus]|nr:iron ABC transporter permease [Phocaeicola vulgatus]
MLQTTFNNPLADPSILGISSGASLGVALVMLAGAGTITAGVFTLSGFLSVIIGAFIGSMLVMGIILFFSTLIKNSIMFAHYRYHDRVYHFICHLPAQLFLHGRRGAFLHDLGNGKLWRSIFAAAFPFSPWSQWRDC